MELGSVFIGIGDVKRAAIQGDDLVVPVVGAPGERSCDWGDQLIVQSLERLCSEAGTCLRDAGLTRHRYEQAGEHPLQALEEDAQNLFGGLIEEQSHGEHIVDDHMRG